MWQLRAYPLRTVPLLALVGLFAGCGGGAKREGAYVDRLPLPIDTMTTRMIEPGVYGGRFVFGSTAGPKTFNAIPSGEGMEKPKDKAAQQDATTPTTSVQYTVVRVAHAKTFLRSADGAKPATAFDQVPTEGNPPTSEKLPVSVLKPFSSWNTPFRPPPRSSVPRRPQRPQ